MHSRMPLNDEQLERVERAAAEASAGAPARIVVAAVPSSGRYDRAEDLLALWAAAIGLTLILAFFATVPLARTILPKPDVWRLGILPVLGTIAAGFIVGTVLATQIRRLRRWFVPTRQLEANVRERAAGMLEEIGEGKAVLIYASAYERLSCIAATEPLRARLGDVVRAAEQSINASFKAGHLESTLCDAISLVAQQLKAAAAPQTAQSPLTAATAIAARELHAVA